MKTKSSCLTNIVCFRPQLQNQFQTPVRCDLADLASQAALAPPGSEVQVSLETELFFRPKQNPAIYQKIFDNHSSVVDCDRQCTIFVFIIFLKSHRKIITTKIVHCLSQSTTDDWLSKIFWHIVCICFARKKSSASRETRTSDPGGAKAA